MNNKKILLLVFAVLFLTSFVTMISAAMGVGLVYPTRNLTNASSLNLTGPGQYLNASLFLVDGTSLVGNVTFYYQPVSYNHNGTWTLIANKFNTTANQSTYNTTWTTAGVADGVYILNVTSLNANSTNVNATNATIHITIDNTAPTTIAYGGAALTAYANGTSIKTAATFANNLTLNISVTDATVGLLNSSNAFCFINVAGGFNHSVPLTANRWCNSSDINITGLTDGNKTINIYVNDSLNNMRLNSTLVVQIDTTVPTASATCSPTTVQTGASFPCTCSTSDATSGINAASSGGTSTSPDGTATPSSTGIFTYTCGATDNGGLTASTTATYSVTQPPSTGGGATTTTTWTTHAITESIFEQGYTKELGVKSRIKVQIESADHFIGVVSISATSATIEISSDPVRVTLSAGEDTKADVNNDGFYDVYVLLNGITNNKADVTIQKIHEEISEEGAGLGEGEEEEEEKGGISAWIWILIAIVVIAIVVWQIKARKR
jgi:hypothetical protein